MPSGMPAPPVVEKGLLNSEKLGTQASLSQLCPTTTGEKSVTGT